MQIMQKKQQQQKDKKVHFLARDDQQWQIAVNIYRTVERSAKSTRKKPGRQIEKNLKNIIWYSSYESSKTGKCNTFLVSFIIPLSWP